MINGFQRILVAVDGSAASDAAVTQAAALSSLAGAQVLVAHVTQIHPGRFGAVHEAHSEADALVRTASDTITRLGGVVGTAITEVEGIRGVAWDLLALARAEAVDLICLGNKGHGPWVGAVLGSTAQRILHHSPCAVLLVPAPGDAGDQPVASHAASHTAGDDHGLVG